MTTKPSATPLHAAREPSSGSSSPAQTLISIWLVIHLFCIAVALTSNVAPSVLQVRLWDVLAIYTRTLNFDLNFTPYELTHAGPDDVDHRIEVLPANADPAVSANWIVVGMDGFRAADGYKRFQRLAKVTAFLVDSDRDEAAAEVALHVAKYQLHHAGVVPAKIRIRKHWLQSRDVFRNGTPAQRDPDAESYFEVVYQANAIVFDDNTISIVKDEEASQVAAPDEVSP